MHTKFSSICKHNLSIYNKQKTITTNKKPIIKNDFKSEYSLKQNLFDPTKSSPPNDFMLKLKQRMSVYNNNTYYEAERIDDNFDNA